MLQAHEQNDKWKECEDAGIVRTTSLNTNVISDKRICTNRLGTQQNAKGTQNSF